MKFAIGEKVNVLKRPEWLAEDQRARSIVGRVGIIKRTPMPSAVPTFESATYLVEFEDGTQMGFLSNDLGHVFGAK